MKHGGWVSGACGGLAGIAGGPSGLLLLTWTHMPTNTHQSPPPHFWLCVKWFATVGHEMTDIMWESSQGIWHLTGLWLTTCPWMNIHGLNLHWQQTQVSKQMGIHLGTCVKMTKGQEKVQCYLKIFTLFKEVYEYSANSTGLVSEDDGCKAEIGSSSRLDRN